MLQEYDARLKCGATCGNGRKQAIIEAAPLVRKDFRVEQESQFFGPATDAWSTLSDRRLRKRRRTFRLARASYAMVVANSIALGAVIIMIVAALVLENLWMGFLAMIGNWLVAPIATIVDLLALGLGIAAWQERKGKFGAIWAILLLPVLVGLLVIARYTMFGWGSIF